jgi:hypothetical protein
VNATLYNCTVADEDPANTHFYFIVGADHPTNGTGFQVNRTSGVVTRGPWKYWEDGKERSPLSFEDGALLATSASSSAMCMLACRAMPCV